MADSRAVLAGALANLALGAVRAPKAVVTVIGVGSVGAATVATYMALWQYLHQSIDVVVEPYFTWISAGEITVDASLQLDPLSAVMLAFVTFVGFLIHVYSVGYMSEESEAGYARYFSYLNLFMFAMLLLVLGSNLPVLFVGWEGVGLCSYLLIGYYFEKQWCAAAGSKAFIVNRIGDLGFLLAIFATFAVFGSVEFDGSSRPPRAIHSSTRGRRRSSRCCSLSARSASPPRSRSTSGCPTPWPARRRCRP